MATLTYSYADSTIVIGPISVYAEPHSYDLCTQHADAVNAPRGWETMRLEYGRTTTDDDDLLALAEAVREPRRPPQAGEEPSGDQRLAARQAPAPLSAPEGGAGIARGHLRLLRD